jgi:hypothetical protein
MSAPRNATPRPPLTPAQKRVIKLVVAIIGVLGLASFGQAYSAVSGWAGAHGFHRPWSTTLPLILDGAVVASLMGAVLFTSLNMHRWWMHLVSLGLAFPTIYLNWSAGDTRTSSLAHAAVASVYIVFAEIGQWALRSWMRREGILPHDVIRGSRWLVAPVQTSRIKMRMIKWEISSYAEALDAEKKRLRAVATARRLFGRRWRSKIGGDVRLGLSLGEVDDAYIKALAFRLAAERGTRNAPPAVPTAAPRNVPTAAEHAEHSDAERAPSNPAERKTERSTAAPKPRPARTTGTALAALTAEELLVLDRISGDNNGKPSVRAITAGFRAERLTISQAAALELARVLKADADNPDRAGALDSAIAARQGGNSDELS